MRRTYKEMLEGCKYYKESNKRKRIRKTVGEPQIGGQLPLPFPGNEALREEEEKDRK